MVFLQAVTNERGPAFACFRLVEDGQLSLVLSPQVLSEVQQVLGRTKIRAKFPHLTDERVGGFLHWIEEKGIALDEVPRAFSYLRDPNDEPYINLAIASDARYLVRSCCPDFAVSPLLLKELPAIRAAIRSQNIS
ncbi:MAG TPA: putative toxin-antitoxin system toxin component, PIN family, partial [Isosphaeraceae bacterium]|nr:putative toxin-antitoxin system toxin component, PIN family [Isosphaeraceae bacterium]